MTSILGNTRKPDIIFHTNGQIDITARLASQLALHSGDVIDILRDQGEYYLIVRHRAPLMGRHQGMAFRSNGRGGHFRAWSKTLAQAILRESKTTTERARLLAGPPIQLPTYGTAIPLITHNPIE